MVRRIRVRCRHCGWIVLIGGRTKHLRKKHPEQKGSYKKHFDFEIVDFGDFKRVKT